MNDLFDVVQFEDAWLSEVAEFTAKIDKKHYEGRNQGDERNIGSQQYSGKLAEFVVWDRFSRHFPITPPDTKIYTARQKSFDADHHIGEPVNRLLHVKCCDEARKMSGNISWTFQWADARGYGGRDHEIFDTPGDSLVALVHTNVACGHGQICAILETRELNERNYFADPFKADLKGIKKVVFEADLKQDRLIRVVPDALKGFHATIPLPRG
jgi:hypothetical protein